MLPESSRRRASRQYPPHFGSIDAACCTVNSSDQMVRCRTYRCEIRFVSAQIWAHNPLPKPFTPIARVSSRRLQRANTHQNPPSRKFVGKTPTEILDFSVNQLGCLSDFHRLPLSGKCTLTISVPFVVFFNASEQTFYQA